jgi:tRNA pseudouridine38-40 synthase
MDCEFIPLYPPSPPPCNKRIFFLTNFFYDKKRFDAWIRSLDFYSGNDLLYLSPSSGTIPDAAVIKRGVKREKPFKERKVFDSTTFPDKNNKLVEDEESFDADDDDDDDDDLPINRRDLVEMEG